jgi:hypothetical protein
MRVRAAVTLISGSAIAASALFLACGNGDDFEAKPSPVADAAADGTVHEAGAISEAGATSEAGETSDAEAGAISEAGATSEAGTTSDAESEAGATSEAGPDGG